MIYAGGPLLMHAGVTMLAWGTPLAYANAYLFILSAIPRGFSVRGESHATDALKIRLALRGAAGAGWSARGTGSTCAPPSSSRPIGCTKTDEAARAIWADGTALTLTFLRQDPEQARKLSTWAFAARGIMEVRSRLLFPGVVRLIEAELTRVGGNAR